MTTVLESGWRFVMGIWLYGVVAGVSYAIRAGARLADQREIALRAQALAAEARLGQLRSQLNPHFLFNALHTVAYLIGHDTDRAKEAVERIGDMLRYAIDQGGELVTLEREWTFVRDYLAIERMRLEERLAIEVDIDERLLGHRVPVFSLQTLVENAVRHAVARRGSATHITIRARQDESSIVLEVHDDGPGIDVASINASAGLGLRNLRDRLEALFSDRASLQLESEPGHGFRAVVSIPHEPRSFDPPRPLSTPDEVFA